MKNYEEEAGSTYEETCYIAEGVESGVLNEDGSKRKDKRKWKEVPPNPKCKICGGRGYQTYGNDCTCIWKEVRKNEKTK